MDDRQQPTEIRAVRSQDPSLSSEANRLLTDELRRVIGTDQVELPASRPHGERRRQGARPRVLVGLIDNRLIVALTLLGALVVGAIISLSTGSWWFLVLALGLDMLGTLLIVGLVLQLTMETEHLSPGAAARLEDEGVGDPDALFTDLVEEFAPDDAAAEQRSAMTPSRHRGRPVGPS